MEAYVYPTGTYTFQYGIGLTGTNIDFIDVDDSGGTCAASIIADYVARFGVLKLLDNDAANILDIDHTGFNINTTGAIEYYFYNKTGNDWFIELKDGATQLIRFSHESDYAFDYDRGAGQVEIMDNTNGFHWKLISIRIDVDAGVNGQFDCYIYDYDGTEIANVQGIEFENNATTVDTIRIYSVAGDSSATAFHIDAMGITAEGSYTLGDLANIGIDLADYMEDVEIKDGIIPFRKTMGFICHPDYHTYFNEDEIISVLDASQNVLFAGIIKSKGRDENGIYVFYCEDLRNEMHDRTYDKSFATDNTGEKQQDIIDNSLQFCYRSASIVATALDWSYEYERAPVYMFNLARFLERQVAYVEPDGKVLTKAYDGLVATGKSWTYGDGGENLWLLGYSNRNTGITSVPIRYKDNTLVVRPATPSETFRKKRLKEFRDPKIQEAATAQQLGDNLYSIFSADTMFIKLRVEGQGWLQPGKTIQFESTKQISITQANFLIIKVVYDPKNDRHEELLLSNNIITQEEFNSNFDTSGQQAHTGALQTFENQDELHKLFAIGSANKRWKSCALLGFGVFADVALGNTYRNVGANDITLTFLVLPEPIVNGRNLIITDTKIKISDSDAGDYVDRFRMFTDTGATLVDVDHDTVHGTGTGTFTYGHADQTIGGVYDQIHLFFECVNTNANDLDIMFVQIEYYYG